MAHTAADRSLPPRAPAVSVLLPVHNGMPYLPAAVGSVLAQTFCDFELLVVDDGSTDGTPAYLRTLTDPRVRVERLEKVGLVAALNHGLDIARGAIVARFDADDIAVPTRLEKQYALINEPPECVLVSCQFIRIDHEGQAISESCNPTGDQAIRWSLLFGTPFLHPGAMFRRDAALAVGKYRGEFPVAQDYDLWARLAAKGRLAIHPEKLVLYRTNLQGTSARNRPTQRLLASRIAARYAEAESPLLRGDLVSDLHLFCALGQLPESGSPEALADIFCSARRHFLEKWPSPSEELLLCIQEVQQRLRWRCLHQARQRWFDPLAVIRWVRLVRRFDPEQFRLGALARLVWGRLIRGGARPLRGPAHSRRPSLLQ